MAKAEETVPMLHRPKRFGLPTTDDIIAMGNAIADCAGETPGRGGERTVRAAGEVAYR